MHYCVAVFHDSKQSVDELLAPYNRDFEVAPYLRLSRQEAIDYARKTYDTNGKTDEECWRMMFEYRDIIDKDGNIYSTNNPQGKWTEYIKGGKWSNLLQKHGLLKSDGDYSSARVGDIPFTPDKEAYLKATNYWNKFVVGNKSEYYTYRYGTMEQFCKSVSEFHTYAVITPDGVWHSFSDKEWFGTPHESIKFYEEVKDWENHYRERFIDTANPDWILTIVDCCD